MPAVLCAESPGRWLGAVEFRFEQGDDWGAIALVWTNGSGPFWATLHWSDGLPHTA
jgi:hypothetical protein